MKSLINKMKKIEFNEMLINDFIELFNSNNKAITNILLEENSIFNANYKYDYMLKVVNRLKDYEYDNIKKYFSIGTVACITNGDTYFVLELILKSLLKKTKIIFATESYMFSINTYLVKLAQKVLENHGISKEAISIHRIKSYKDVIEEMDNLDCIVVNKDYDLYKTIEELTNIKVVYSDYGNINVYSESEDFKSQIEIICEKAQKEDKDIFLIETKDIQKHLDSMNNNSIFYSVVIYTKNLEKCKYFFKNIKAENVYINKDPFEYIDVNFSEFEFLYKKKIVY